MDLIKNWLQAQTFNIEDLAIHGVVGQKSDFHGNSDIQIPKTRPFRNNSKKISGQNKLTCQRYLVQEIDPWCITKSRIRYTYAFWFF
jgi:hypothetical protein